MVAGHTAFYKCHRQLTIESLTLFLALTKDTLKRNFGIKRGQLHAE